MSWWNIFSTQIVELPGVPSIKEFSNTFFEIKVEVFSDSILQPNPRSIKGNVAEKYLFIWLSVGY